MAEAAPDPNAGGDGTVKGGSAAMAEVRRSTRRDHVLNPTRPRDPRAGFRPQNPLVCQPEKRHRPTWENLPPLPNPVALAPRPETDGPFAFVSLPPTDIPPELPDGQDARDRLLRQG